LGSPIFGFKLFVAAHFLAAALAAARAARALTGASPGAAALAGIVYAGSGTAVSTHWHLVWTAAAPWLALAVAEARVLARGEGADGRRPPRARTAAILAGSLALMALAGGVDLLYGLAFLIAA